MRGGLLFRGGLAMMAVATLVAVGAVYMVTTREGGRAVTPEPAATTADAHTNAGPSERAGRVERKKKPNTPRQENAKRPEHKLPASPPPRMESREAETREVQAQRALPPAADTVTSVTVNTCDGGVFDLNAAEKQMLDLHNQKRSEYELNPLCVSPDLTRVARAHSQDMLDRDYFSHYTPEGTTVTEHMEELGYPVSTSYATGENIALGGDRAGGGSPDNLFGELMNSPGHRANILAGLFREVGVGSKRGVYQGFGSDDPATAYTIDFGAQKATRR